MPDYEITITDAEYELLDSVRQQQGLDTVQQATEWLAKSRLRKLSEQVSGRGRALYAVDRKPS